VHGKDVHEVVAQAEAPGAPPAKTGAAKPKAKPRMMADGEERKRGPAGRTSMYKVPFPLLHVGEACLCTSMYKAPICHSLPNSSECWCAACHACLLHSTCFAYLAS
jgi:hypothetical protein